MHLFEINIPSLGVFIPIATKFSRMHLFWDKYTCFGILLSQRQQGSPNAHLLRYILGILLSQWNEVLPTLFEINHTLYKDFFITIATGFSQWIYQFSLVSWRNPPLTTHIVSCVFFLHLMRSRHARVSSVMHRLSSGDNRSLLGIL